jgi:nuclear transport factor 2 (NTF2) superfamily protein
VETQMKKRAQTINEKPIKENERWVVEEST